MNVIPGNSEDQAHSSHYVWKMFDRIASRYDLLNRLLSFRQDVRWRNRVALRMRGRDKLELLDLATGTADQILAFFKKKVSVQSAWGLDMSEGMLAKGRRKIADKGLESLVTLEVGDATDIPLPDNRFDVVTVSFGIRNVTDVHKALREIHRVLKPGGQALILEFSLPKSRVIRTVYLLYFRHVLPLIGSLISGDAHAYRYLNETAETFPYGQAFCDMMISADMVHVHCKPLSFGIASIYEGWKKNS